MSETTNNTTETTEERERERAERIQRENAETMQKLAEQDARLQMKAGDECYILHTHSRHYYTRHTVTRITDASIFIGATAYRRSAIGARSVTA